MGAVVTVNLRLDFSPSSTRLQNRGLFPLGGIRSKNHPQTRKRPLRKRAPFQRGKSQEKKRAPLTRLKTGDGLELGILQIQMIYNTPPPAPSFAPRRAKNTPLSRTLASQKNTPLSNDRPRAGKWPHLLIPFREKRTPTHTPGPSSETKKKSKISAPLQNKNRPVFSNGILAKTTCIFGHSLQKAKKCPEFQKTKYLRPGGTATHQ